AVKAKYQEMLDAEADQRGLVRRKTVLAELEPAIAWWYGAHTIPAYYTEPKEMYAAAFSILANNPAALKKHAPTYWRLWHTYLMQRPQVAARWKEYQHLAETGRIQNERDRRQQEAIHAAELTAEKAARARHNLTPAENAEAIGMFLFRDSLSITLRAGRASPEVKNRVLKAYKDNLYHDGWGSAYMLRTGNEVGRPMFEEAGVPETEWRVFLQNMHIAENRQDIASMLGMNPAASQAALEEQRLRVGDRAFEAMRGAAAAWAELRQRYVIQDARDAGTWSEELYNTAMQRVWYSTVRGVDLDKEPLEAALRGMHGGEVGPRIHSQKGYLGAARDPWPATLELERAIIANNFLNRLKAAVHDMLADIQDPLFREGRMRFDKNTNRQVPETGATDRAETIVYLVDGKPRSFWAPKALAEYIDSADPFSVAATMSFLKLVGRDFRGIYTFWNYGFPLFNTPRDIMDWTINLPGWKTKGTYYRYQKRAKPLVDSILAGAPNADAIKMLERNILMLWPQGLIPGESTTAQKLGTLIPGPAGRALQRMGPQSPLERLARAYQVPGGWMGLSLTRRQQLLRAAADWYTRPTARGEMVRKVAAWLFLEDRFPNETDDWRQRQVQLFGGSPDFLDRVGGEAPGMVSLFWNAAMRGAEARYKAYQQDFWKTLVLSLRYGLIPKLILAGLGMGAFRKVFRALLGDETGDVMSDEYQRMTRSIPDYYKSNYAAYPIWWDPTDPGGKKVVFMTNPLSEMSRLESGLLWKLLWGRDVADLLDFGADQLPGFNPIPMIAAAWLAAARGHNPPWVRIPHTQFEAGHWVGPMTKYTLNNLLGGMIGRFSRDTMADQFKSPLQRFLELPVVGNTIGRRIRVSDKGWDDWARDQATPIADVEAEYRQRAYDDAKREARTGRLPASALDLYARGAQILAVHKDDKVPYLPRELYLPAYYAQKLRDARRQMYIEQLPADQRILWKHPRSALPALLNK
ncbi:MAG: hypothetical protein ABII82_13880, partial [Verrucomicrobiota bacterium]